MKLKDAGGRPVGAVPASAAGAGGEVAGPGDVEVEVPKEGKQRGKKVS